MRPPTPVPVTSDVLSPLSANSLRTIGESRSDSAVPAPAVPSLAAPSLDTASMGGVCAEAASTTSAGGGGWRWRWSSCCGGWRRGGGRGWRRGRGRGWSSCCGGWRRGGGLGRRCRRARTLADHGEAHPDLDRLALGNEDLGHDAGSRRWDLGVHLVRRYLEEGFVAGDRVADGLHPSGHGSLGHRLAQLRHRDVSQRAVPFR